MILLSHTSQIQNRVGNSDWNSKLIQTQYLKTQFAVRITYVVRGRTQFENALLKHIGQDRQRNVNFVGPVKVYQVNLVLCNSANTLREIH